MARLLVAMSGGVDSAVSALLLKQAGHDLTGVFMKNYEPPTGTVGPCPWEQDQADVAATCAVLAIPWESWNFEKAYADRVLEYFFREYQDGRTPNPDIMCNREIKFGVFLQRALAEGFEAIATGHYARNEHRAGTYHLLAGVDVSKDQTYFLHQLTQRELAHVLFPIGNMQKTVVRELAREAGLPVADKPDSQGICFVGKVDVAEFLQNHVMARPGKVLTAAGEYVGEHRGLPFYTIGQRHGLGVGGGVPYFVAKKNLKDNTLIVAQGNRDTTLFASALNASQVSWVAGRPPVLPLSCQARIRYRQPLVSCRVDEHAQGLCVTFNEPQRAITPGQSIVFYANDDCLGGAVIDETCAE